MKRIFVMLLLALTMVNLVAQASSNPRDGIYTDIDRWYNLGLIETLPPIRPYPTQFILHILNEVINNGSESDIKGAQTYYNQYDKTSLDVFLKHNSFTNMEEYQTISGFGAGSNISINNYVSASLDINAYLLNGVNELCTPPNRNMGIDVNIDNMGIDAFGMSWDMFQSLNMNAAFGNEKMWIQTGMMPTSFGPLFDDSIILNPNAKQAAHFSYTWIEDNFTLSYLFLPIVATDNTGNNESDNKFLHIRSLDFKITSFWDFQFLETAIYGGKAVKPIFFLPFNEFFYSAGQGGTWDVNSLIGLGSRFQLPNNISLKGTVYVDDVNARQLAKLNFDTKLKLAAQFVIDWTPKKSIINGINLSYTALMPYIYSHITETPNVYDNDDWDIRHHALSSYMNYENYTNGGVTMGPYGMEPNSDKIAFNISANMPNDFKVKINAEVQRHGNSSSVSDREANNAIATDGTIFDSGYGWESGFLYQDSNPFLTQSIIETMFAGELVLTTPKLALKRGSISGEAGYSYVYILNKNLVKNDTFSNSYFKLSAQYNF